MPAALKALTTDPGHRKNQSGSRITYTIKYTATYTEDPGNAFNAEALAGIVKGAALSFASALRLDVWETKETDNPTVWKFNCTYQNSTVQSGGGSNSIDLEPFTWTEHREEVLTNTAGDPLPGLQTELHHPGFKLVWEKSSLDMSAFELAGDINDTALTVAGIAVPKYCMKAGALEFQKITDGTNTTWRHSLPLYLCFKKARGTGATHVPGDLIGFQREYVNNGFNIHDGTDLKEIVLNDGSKPSGPVRINAAGTAALDKADPDHMILYTPPEQNSFSSLNIPSSAPS